MTQTHLCGHWTFPKMLVNASPELHICIHTPGPCAEPWSIYPAASRHPWIPHGILRLSEPRWVWGGWDRKQIQLRNWALTPASENLFPANSREKDRDIPREWRRNEHLGGKYHVGVGMRLWILVTLGLRINTLMGIKEVLCPWELKTGLCGSHTELGFSKCLHFLWKGVLETYILLGRSRRLQGILFVSGLCVELRRTKSYLRNL